MILAVKFYGVGNPQGFAEDWPKECRELPDGSSLPSGFDVLMTPIEYNEHRALRIAAARVVIDASNTQKEATIQSQIASATVLFQDLQAAENGWGSLTAGQKDQVLRGTVRLLLKTAKLLGRLYEEEIRRE